MVFRKVGDYVPRLGVRPVLRRDPRCARIRAALKKVSGGTLVNAIVEIRGEPNTYMGECTIPCRRRGGQMLEGERLGAWKVTLRG